MSKKEVINLLWLDQKNGTPLIEIIPDEQVRTQLLKEAVANALSFDALCKRWAKQLSDNTDKSAKYWYEPVRLRASEWYKQQGPLLASPNDWFFSEDALVFFKKNTGKDPLEAALESRKDKGDDVNDLRT